MGVPRFEISPLRGMVDAPLEIRLKGLPAGELVTVRSSIADGIWRAEASFEVGADGIVDLEKQAPVFGSYATVDSMGLIWSASLVASQEVIFRLSSLDTFAITFDAVYGGNVLASARVLRDQISVGVQREVVREHGLFGTLFVPPNEGPHPAVMLVSGSGGGLDEGLASLFAAHGIAGFALAYFNYETLPKGIINIPLEYFETGIEFLQAHPMIDGGRLAITGASRGGELSLLLGSVFSQFKAVVAWVPSGLVWGGFFGGAGEEGGVQPAWRLKGQPVPSMGNIHADEFRYAVDYYRRGEGIPNTPAFLAQMNRYPDRVRAATIPVERINGAVLLISGEDDQMWPSTRMAEISMARLRDHNFAHPHEHLSYPGAGHGIDTPYWPQTVVEARHPVDGVRYAFGGNPQLNAHATVDSWRRVKRFLRENL